MKNIVGVAVFVVVILSLIVGAKGKPEPVIEEASGFTVKISGKDIKFDPPKAGPGPKAKRGGECDCSRENQALADILASLSIGEGELEITGTRTGRRPAPLVECGERPLSILVGLNDAGNISGGFDWRAIPRVNIPFGLPDPFVSVTAVVGERIDGTISGAIYARLGFNK